MKKVTLLFAPFLFIAIGFTVLYSFLHWALFIDREIFSVREDILNFWLPIGLPLIPLFTWLRPRIKLLKLKRKSGDLPFL